MSFDHTILKGTTSKIVEVILRDSSTGAGKTAVAHTDVTASYVREGGTRTAITLAAGTAGDAYSTGKWCEVDSTNCPGLYQLHLPNAALATGVDAVTTTLTATGVIDKVVRISLLDVDLRDATDAGLSNLDAAISTRSTVAATDIVSGGAITTSGGAVSNVTLVDTTTTNTDMVSVAGLSTFDHTTDQVVASNMRGTDGANTVAPDNASIAAILVDTGTDIPASIAALNDLSSTDVTNAVWDASTSSHNVAGSFGRGFRQVKEGLVSIDGQVDDLSATTTSFISNLASAVDDFYNDQTIHFISGSLTGQSRVVVDYNGTTKAITVDQALTSAPANGDEFIILSNHVHSVAEIVDAVWSEDQSSYTTAGSFGYYLDAQVSAAGVTPPTAAAIADAVWDEVRSPDHVTEGTFGYYVDAQVSSAGAGGSGLYQVTVTVQNESAEVLQGARVNVDGTTLTLVTDSSGQCVFNLDSGIYTLHVSPPAGYQTPTGNVITITSSDVSSTFTLAATTPSGDCDVPWVG